MQVSEAADFAGSPDHLERLWTPHRMAYINGDNRPTDSSSEGCPFCLAPGKSDAEGLIVYRGQECFVVMNLFPYNSGHVLICPYRHVAMYPEASESERFEMADLTAASMEVLGAVLRPDGFNLGINQGAVAGAGVAAHLHQHVVPRWSGDANFFPLIAQTKALPELLESTRERLAQGFEEYFAR